MCIEKEEELGMPERQRRVTTEVFVGGLDREVKEEDVRAGEIIEVWMVKDARARKSRGYFFVRHRESMRAKRAVSEFCEVKVVSTHLNQFINIGFPCMNSQFLLAAH